MFSRTHETVRQIVRSARRDCAVWMIGALCPSSRPATTTATTPEAWSSSASRYAANGTTIDTAVSKTGSWIRRRTLQTTQKITSPASTPPPAATTKSTPDLERGHARPSPRRAPCAARRARSRR